MSDIALTQLTTALRRSKQHTLEQVSGLASATAAAIAEAAHSTVPVTVPAAGWTVDNNETTSFVNYYDITAAGVTTHDVAIVTIHRGSITAAQTAGLCPQNETLTGQIRLRAKTAPASNIVAEDCICPGRED